jgi:1-aminocyclopropane-1-carboxylate deaminase
MGVAVPLSDFPRYPLMFGPSPVHPLERLSAYLGGASIWAKREDCNAGLAFEETRAQVAKIARNTAGLIGLGRELRAEEITVLGGWAGDYYGVPDPSTLDAIRLLGRLEGIIADPVYEGKSMAGLAGLVRNGEIGKDSTVLYAHLGGQPALSAYGALFC